ncbi:hypothetical protein CLAFUR4_03130 [Fulvia fulva]|nr:hypothetical protein CLAFUR4_03130 [Fulvia fulva]KAK4633889.1 hypothetical protein CLAFUR0_03135 [Fulvia fulva]WPV25938.1 hypothetical protein CLAFUW7_03134 [Fulvia fulva]
MSSSTHSDDWVFRLCGTCTSKTIDIRRLAEEDIEAEILDLFEAESDVQVSYHQTDEYCKDSRSLKTLFEPGAYQNTPVHIHFSRQPTPTAEAGSWFAARLSFRLADDSPMRHISPTFWPSRLMMVHRGSTTAELVSNVRRLVRSKLERDPLLNDVQVPTDEVLEDEHKIRPRLQTRFKTIVHSPTDALARLDLDCEDAYISRVEIIQDLFHDLESVQHMEIPITIKLWISEQTVQDGHNVVTRCVPKHTTPLHVRIGSFAYKTAGIKGNVTVEYPLLAKIRPVSFRYDGLCRMEAWDFDDLAINDVHHATWAPFNRFHLEGQFRSAQNERQLAIQVEKAHERGDYGRIPQLPTMALRPTHQASDIRQKPSAEVTVAVSFVNHLPDDAFQNLNMAINCQLALTDHDAPADAEQEIFKFIKEAASTAGYTLFNVRAKDTWRCELWVMNQDYISPKLYRFEDGTFAQFMLRERMEERGRKMYMECHIWPKEHRTARALPC